ncbi:MAG: hypothetical protein EOO48_04540 [Flavobacterium sp.]|nr:MAG: hypothetical protein EOO48_04540 [Flavobacterium sp.]
MKNFKMFMLTAAICLTAAPFFNSCNDMTDDSAPTDNSGVAGTYKMTAFNIPGDAIDFDNNGTSSNNLVSESDCFNSNLLRLNSDHTYLRVDNYIDLSSGVAACAEFSETGVWTKDGDVVTTTSSTSNGYESYQTSYDYNSGSGTMTLAAPNFTYPTIDSGSQTTAVGDVNFVFTKQ